MFCLKVSNSSKGVPVASSGFVFWFCKLVKQAGKLVGGNFVGGTHGDAHENKLDQRCRYQTFFVIG